MRKLLARALAILAIIAVAGPAAAYDPTQASRYGSPNFYRPNIDRLIIQGDGSTGDASTFCVKVLGSSICNFLSVRLGWSVYVTDFMAPGSTDIGPAITSAVASLGQGGGTVIVPRRDDCYTLAAPLTLKKNNTNIKGDAIRGASCIKSNFQGTVLSIGDPASFSENIRVEDITLRSAIARTSGAMVRIINTYNPWVVRITCDLQPYICVDYYVGAGGFMAHIDDLFVPAAGYVGVRVGYGETGPAPAGTIYIARPTIFHQSRAGVELNHTVGTFILGGVAAESGNGLLLAPQDGQVVTANTITDFFADTSINDGVALSPGGTGVISDTTFNALWSGTNGYRSEVPAYTTAGAGVSLNGTCDNIKSIRFNAPTLVNNGGEGFKHLGGCFVDLIGPEISFNSQYSGGGALKYDGMYVAAGVSRWTITGGRIGLGTRFTSQSQRYGLYVAPGISNQYYVTGVDFAGNTAGSTFDGGTGVSKKIEDPLSKTSYGSIGVGINTSQTLSVLATGANAAIPNGSGLLVVSDYANGLQAVALLGGGGVVLVAQVGNQFIASTTPSPGQVGIGYEASSGTYRVYNNKGSALNYATGQLSPRMAN